jgi:hypothetical protein
MSTKDHTDKTQDDSEPRKFGDKDHKSPTHDREKPDVNPDTRSDAHDARKNVGNSSDKLERAPIDNSESHVPRPKPRDNVSHEKR